MESVDVALACPTPAAAIFYTTDDTPPGPHSPVFRAPIRLDHVGLTVLRARAVREGMWESDEISLAYFVLMQVACCGRLLRCLPLRRGRAIVPPY